MGGLRWHAMRVGRLLYCGALKAWAQSRKRWAVAGPGRAREGGTLHACGYDVRRDGGMAGIAQAGAAQAGAAQAGVRRQVWRRQARRGAVGPETDAADLGWRRVDDVGAARRVPSVSQSELARRGEN